MDKEVLEDTFVEWEAGMKKRIPEYKKEGMRVEKVLIDVDELVAWCREKQIPVDGKARALYAAEALMEGR